MWPNDHWPVVFGRLAESRAVAKYRFIEALLALKAACERVGALGALSESLPEKFAAKYAHHVVSGRPRTRRRARPTALRSTPRSRVLKIDEFSYFSVVVSPGATARPCCERSAYVTGRRGSSAGMTPPLARSALTPTDPHPLREVARGLFALVARKSLRRLARSARRARYVCDVARRVREAPVPQGRERLLLPGHRNDQAAEGDLCVPQDRRGVGEKGERGDGPLREAP